MRDVKQMINRGKKSIEKALYSSQSESLERISKAILFIGLRGKRFDAEQYMLWNYGPDWEGINPYIHAALFGLRQRILEFSYGFRDVVKKSFSEDRKWILIVTHDQSRTGAPVLALALAVELAKKYNIATLALGPGQLRENFIEASSLLIQNHGPRKKSKFLASRIKRLCSQHSFEYALVNSKESIHVAELLTNFGVRTTLLIHEFPAYSPYTPQQQIGLQASNKIVLSSELVAKEIIETGIIKDLGRLSVLPQGRPSIPRNLREKESIDLAFRQGVSSAFAVDGGSNHLRILGAGTVILRKGVDLFISLALAARQNPLLREAKFVWVGDGLNTTDTCYSLYVFDQIRRSGIGDSLVFLPASHDFQFAVQTSDVLALTSRLDPLPNVVIDSLSSGRHVVCFESASGYPELFREHPVLSDGIARYLDVQSMLSKLERLAVAKNSGTLESERDSILNFAQERFDLKKYAESLDRLSSE